MAEETIGGRAFISSPTNRTSRWGQLIACILCMVLIANLQYGWTYFVGPMQAKHGWSLAGIQFGFSLFIALETWLTPVWGFMADSRWGPRASVGIGGILVAFGWVLNANAETLSELYLGQILSGAGGAAVYATGIGLAVKWFPDRRGLATGLTAAGYGAGSALSVIPILHIIRIAGYESAFFWFGIVQGLGVFLIAWLLRAPEPDDLRISAKPKVTQSARSFSPLQMLQSGVFWLLFIMFIMVSASGLMATAQFAPIAKDFGVGGVTLVFGLSTMAFAGIVDNVCNGGARPLFGWVSDHIGRENTMALAFGIGGVAYWLLGTLGHAPWAFVLFAALIFLTWGEIFSLFPSTCTDTFGPKFATVNLSLLYMAKGASAFFVPLANVARSWTGSWHGVFVFTALLNFAVVALALYVLKPLRSRFLLASR